LAIAAYFDSEDLNQLSDFFFKQADEEREHAMKFFHFILEAGGRVKLPEIPAPQSEFSSATECAELSLEWEEEVTEQINRLVEIARADDNYAAENFLDWFVTEQVEEVNTMSRLISVIERAGDQLLLVEEYLAREGHPEDGG
ncbi:MAG: ferritin, partial [Thermoanaerobaculia bacterium]|nr:ferritin [Thermoanaerobaculia bacterium]